MEKVKEYEGNKYLMIDDYMLDKVFEKIKDIIGIKILIDMDDKLLDDITLNNVVILMTCIIKDDDKFYPQLF